MMSVYFISFTTAITATLTTTHTTTATSTTSSSSIGTTTPYWVLACSTIVEPSQQEGFYRVLLPAARQTPNLEDQ